MAASKQFEFCAYFVSDVHLVSDQDEKADLFIKLVEGLITRALDRAPKADHSPTEIPTHLFLVGDIFDLWVADHEFFVQRYTRVVEVLRQAVTAGIEVHFFEGNHDLHLSAFWERKIGVKVHSDASTFKLGDHDVRVEHGDLINPGDRGYLFLRWFLRSPLMRKLAFSLPSRFVQYIGESASHASRAYTSSDTLVATKHLPQDKIRSLIRAHAERVISAEPFDILISGHVHVRDDHTWEVATTDPSGDARNANSVIQTGMSTKIARSVNLGSWYEAPQAFVLSQRRAEFERIM